MVRRLIVLMIKGYQRYFSPLMPPSCRFYPTCSHYAIQAFTRYSLIKGSYLVARRLLKCHPFHQGGFDPLK